MAFAVLLGVAAGCSSHHTAKAAKATSTTEPVSVVTSPPIPTEPPPPSSPPAVVPVTVSPSTIYVGGSVTVSGHACPPSGRAVVIVGEANTYGNSTIGVATPSADGAWSGTFMVVDGTAVGPTTVGGRCEDAHGYYIALWYGTVTVHTWRHFAVSATAVRPGTTIRIVGNAPCPGDKVDGVNYGLGPDGPTGGMVPQATVTNYPDHSEMVIPPDEPAGRYQITGRCWASRATTAQYEPVTITVT